MDTEILQAVRLLLRRPSLAGAGAILDRYAGDPMVTLPELAHAPVPRRHACLSGLERRGMAKRAGGFVPRVFAQGQWPARRNWPFVQISNLRGHGLRPCPGRLGTGLRYRIASGHGGSGAGTRRQTARSDLSYRPSRIGARDGEVRVSAGRDPAQTHGIPQPFTWAEIRRVQLRALFLTAVPLTKRVYCYRRQP